MPNAIRGNGSKNARAVHVSGMDAVFARREAEAGTESDDLLLQQEEAEERIEDVRDAEEPEGRREQAHGPAVPPEGVNLFLSVAARAPRGVTPFWSARFPTCVRDAAPQS